MPDNYKKNNSNLSDLTKSASKIEILKSRVNSSSSSKISAGGSVGKSLMVTKSLINTVYFENRLLIWTKKC